MIMSKNDYNFVIDEENKEVRVFGHGMMESEDSMRFRKEVALQSLQIDTSKYTVNIDSRKLYLVNKNSNDKNDLATCIQSMHNYYALGYRKFIARILPTQTLMLEIAEVFKKDRPNSEVILNLEEEDENDIEGAFNFANDVLLKRLDIKYIVSSDVSLVEMLNEFKNLFAVLNPEGYTLNFKFLNKNKLEEVDKINFLKKLIPEIRRYRFLAVILNIKGDFALDFMDSKDLEIFQFS